MRLMPLLRALELVMTGEVVEVVVVKEELEELEGEVMMVGLRVVTVEEVWLFEERFWLEDAAWVMFVGRKSLDEGVMNNC